MLAELTFFKTVDFQKVDSRLEILVLIEEVLGFQIGQKLFLNVRHLGSDGTMGALVGDGVVGVEQQGILNDQVATYFF